MAVVKTWKGFDYVQGIPVERPRTEWKALIDTATHVTRAAGDLLIFKGDRLVAEVYDKEKT